MGVAIAAAFAAAAEPVPVMTAGTRPSAGAGRLIEPHDRPLS